MLFDGMGLHVDYLFEWVLYIECTREFFGWHVTEEGQLVMFPAWRVLYWRCMTVQIGEKFLRADC